MGVELLLCLAVALSQNAITCFLESILSIRSVLILRKVMLWINTRQIWGKDSDSFREVHCGGVVLHSRAQVNGLDILINSTPSQQ